MYLLEVLKSYRIRFYFNAEYFIVFNLPERKSDLSIDFAIVHKVRVD